MTTPSPTPDPGAVVHAGTARVAVSERLQYRYGTAEWTPADRHAYRRFDHGSPFTSWRAQVSYGTHFAFTEQQ